jgi:hypothetical protein
MTIDVLIPAASMLVQGTGPYAIPFPYDQGTIGLVMQKTGQRVELVPGEFTVDPNTTTTSGNLYLSDTTATTYAGWTAFIQRETPAEQGWQGVQGAREAGLEAQLDATTKAVQDLARQLSGAVRGDEAVEPIAPVPSSLIGWDANGDLTSIELSSLIAPLGPSFTTRDFWLANGINTDFTLPFDPTGKGNLSIWFDGHWQEPDTWTLSGTLVSFSTIDKPPRGTRIFYELQTPTALGTAGAAQVSMGDGTDLAAVYAKLGGPAIHFSIIPSLSENVANAAANTAAINAALASAASTKRPVRVPPGTYPVNGAIRPPTGVGNDFIWINDPATVWQPVYENLNGFVGPLSAAAEITGARIEYLRIAPAINPATGNPYAGNGFVGIMRDCQVFGMSVEGYWGDQGMLPIVYQTSFYDTNVWTNSTAGGTGAIRILGGADSAFYNTRIRSGDDGIQFVPASAGVYANLSIRNCAFVGGVAISNARPMIAFLELGTTSNVVNCGFFGIRGVALEAENSFACSFAAVSHGSGRIANLQVVGCSIDELQRTVFEPSSHGILILGDVQHSDIQLSICDPMHNIARIGQSADSLLYPSNNRIDVTTDKAPRDGATAIIDIVGGTRNTIVPRIYAPSGAHAVAITGADRTTIGGPGARILGIPSGFAGVRDNTGTRTDVVGLQFESATGGNSYSFAATPATTGRVIGCDLGGLTASGSAPTLSNNRA